jgi:Glycosyl hydrolases family 16
MPGDHIEIDERFEGDGLDPELWFPYYLPQWSSREQAAATYSIGEDGLHLVIPLDQGLWCPDLHDEPLRVSGVQTGSFAGPVGSTIGQQPFKEGLRVREEQPTFWGYTPRYGEVSVTMKGIISPRSMFGFWLAGIEDRPERSGEILVAEVFGESVEDGSAAVGMGIRDFRDPALVYDISAPRLEIDVAEYHTYGVTWEPGRTRLTVDGSTVRSLGLAPDYPMQLMIGVFDFPDRTGAAEFEGEVPELVVSRVRGRTGGR